MAESDLSTQYPTIAYLPIQTIPYRESAKIGTITLNGYTGPTALIGLSLGDGVGIDIGSVQNDGTEDVFGYNGAGDNGSASRSYLAFFSDNATLDINVGFNLAPSRYNLTDTVSFDSPSYRDGVFTLSGQATSLAGVQSVFITAQIDGLTTSLGSATVNSDGSFTLFDPIGAHTQSFITASEYDNAGGTTQTEAPFSLIGELPGNRAELDTYSADGSEVLSQTTFRSNGARVVNVQAAGQTIDLQPFDIVQNHRQAETTFVFTPGDGLDVIHGFKLGGADHDTLQLPSADFANLAAVFRNAGDVGGSAFITDPNTGDAIRLAGVTTAELKAHREDIALM